MQTFKPIQELSKKLFLFSINFKFNTATLVWLGILGFLVSIITEWSLGNKNITQYYWRETLQFIQSYYFWFPTIISVIVAQVTMKLSPQQKPWSRLVIVSLLLILIVRYLIWRSLSTLNLSDP